MRDAALPWSSDSLSDPASAGALSTRPRFWLGYASFWLAVGLALALAAWQDPARAGRQQAWEPFVLEISSVIVIGLLAVGVYRFVAWLHTRAWSSPRQAAAHLAAAPLFCGLHVALMYGLRWPIYTLFAGRPYAPMSPLQALAFEGAKDLVTYVVLVGLATAVQLRQREHVQRLQIAQAQAALNELQLLRLGEQLQPHFLFNCLNGIAALVEENKPKAAVTMIARVGDFLRAALAADGRANASLGEEIELVHHYLAIQVLRFEGALCVEVDVPVALRALMVPRLVLQPLVENAVKHGAPRPLAPLTLRIVARRAADSLHLEVLNTGASAAGTPAGLGKGLDLVRQRLEFLHGDAAALRAEPQGIDGWRVTVTLPAAGHG